MAMASAVALAGGGALAAEPCPGNPNALGTSRVMVVDPAQFPRIGSHDYGRTLPLAPGEVVLTFDDGPMSPYTPRVLEALAQHCVKAVFFMIGRNARHEPQTVRQILAAGHTIGSHTQNHPLRPMGVAQTIREISGGISSIGAALGDPKLLAPFFRFPGLHHTWHGELYLRQRSTMAWSIDVDSNDWKRNTPQGVLHNVLARLDAKGRGIVLLHDVQPKTAVLLPELLTELKLRGYRIVHVVPAGWPVPAQPDLVASGPPVPAVETTGTRAVMPGVASEPRPFPIAVVPPTQEPVTGTVAPKPVVATTTKLQPASLATRHAGYVTSAPAVKPGRPSAKPAPGYIQPMPHIAKPIRKAKAAVGPSIYQPIYRW